MTFNLRCSVEADGANYFPRREHRVLEAIRAEAPDLIGFQEADDYSRAFIRNNLTDEYIVVGVGRDKDGKGEGCPIAFKKNSFDLVNFETRFLSSSPKTFGSRYYGSDQSHCPRLYVHAELKHKDMSDTIHFFNTHLDHKGEISKQMGMTQIVQHISQTEGAFMLTGDMNVQPDSPCVQIPLLMRDRAVKEATEDVKYTFHAYGKRDPFIKIDYIFTDAEPIEAYAMADVPEDGVYISDHYPVCAYIEF